MKPALKWIILIITSLIFLYAFSTSYSSQNIDRLDYVIAIGVDSIPDSDNLEISFEFANFSSFSENSSSQDSEPIINTVVAPSISSAINIMNAYVGKQLNLSHCKVIIFSEELAKKGILSEVTYLMNNTQIRPTANIIVAIDSAKEYIENSVSSLEQVLTKYYDIFPTSSEYTGYTSNILLGEFYESLANKDSGAVTILGKKSKVPNENKEAETQQNTSSGGSSSAQGMNNTSSSGNTQNSNEQGNTSNTTNETSSNNVGNDTSIDTIAPEESVVEGDRGTENIGLCVFKDDKYVGDLSAMETLCYSLLKNEVNNFLVRIDSPFDQNEKIDISMDSLSSSDVDIDISKEHPIVNIKLNLTAKTLTGQEKLDYTNTETLTQLNSTLKDYLSSQMISYLYKTSKEYKADINGFYKFVKRKFATISDFKDYDWAQKYEDTEFNVEINSNIISSLLIQNT